MKKFLILSLCIIAYSSINTMESPPNALDLEFPSPSKLSVSSAHEAIQQPDIAQILNNYMQIRDQIVQSLRAYKDPQEIRDLLVRLHQHCPGREIRITEIKSAAEVAVTTARSKTRAAAAEEARTAIYNPLPHERAILALKHATDEYLNALINKSNVELADGVINQRDPKRARAEPHYRSNNSHFPSTQQ